MISFTKPCDECENGLENPTPSFTESHPLPVPCPSCVDGWLPDDETVEAAAKAIDGYYGETPFPGALDYRPEALAALVAAARYQSEEK